MDYYYLFVITELVRTEFIITKFHYGRHLIKILLPKMIFKKVDEV
jgi:hypothetical protein